MEKINFGEFREKKLVGTNGLLNEFMRAFDLYLLKYMSNEKKVVGPEVRDYYDINEAGQKFLLSLKDELQAFREDYYAQKSAYDIAERIDLNVNIVYPYVKNRTYTENGTQYSTVQTNTPFKDFDKNSLVSYLSSFQILRDIQMDIRLEMLRD